MTTKHTERRTRWLDGAEIIEFNLRTWIEESYVFTLLDRELAFERMRNAKLLCNHCRDSKPHRDRESNQFMHHVFKETSPTVRQVEVVSCYADLIWRNEDQ